jgi:hypothetical protein
MRAMLLSSVGQCTSIGSVQLSWTSFASNISGSVKKVLVTVYQQTEMVQGSLDCYRETC